MNIINITIFGHVDAGKSTLCGQLLYQSGIVSENEIYKLKLLAKENKMESWYLAYIMDISNEERQKGKTIEYSINTLNINNLKINLIDSPGHKNYIQNTILALQISDIGILVVSAKEGEFEAGFMNQFKNIQNTQNIQNSNKEHLIIAKGSGINNIIVVINKLDDQTVLWSEERINYIKNKLNEYVKKININIIDYVEISALNNINIMISKSINENNLIDVITKYNDDKIISITKQLNNTFEKKLIVIEKLKDINYFITVKILSNNITKNDILFNLNSEIEILDLFDKNMIKINDGFENDIILLKIKEKDANNIEIGNLLSNIPVISYSKIIAKIKIINIIDSIPIITKGYSFFLDSNLKSINAKINNIYNKLFLKLGDINNVEIILDSNIFINNKYFIMRNNEKIIGIGIIEKFIE